MTVSHWERESQEVNDVLCTEVKEQEAGAEAGLGSPNWVKMGKWWDRQGGDMVWEGTP